MEVRKGETVYIYAGTQLAWNASTTKTRIIDVKGTLMLEGWEEEPVTVSGTLEEFPFGLKPSSEKWDGFLVETGGELHLNRVRLYNAPTAIISFSENVSLRKVHFKGVQGIIGPNKEVRIEGRDADIDSLDFHNMQSQKLIEVQAVDSGSAKPAAATTLKPRKNTLGWSLLGTGALLAGGGLVWYLVDDKGVTPSPGVTNLFSTKPGFPLGEPRQ